MSYEDWYDLNSEINEIIKPDIKDIKDVKDICKTCKGYVDHILFLEKSLKQLKRTIVYVKYELACRKTIL